MIIGIGVDNSAISRFQKFLDDGNSALIERIFTETEREYCLPKKSAAASLAARFSAKEAFFKALGTGLRDGMSWHNVSVTNNGQGKPEFILTGAAREKFDSMGGNRHFLTLSHDGDMAVAMVVLEGT